MVKKGLAELEQFTLTRGEYAKRLGITPNAVRMRQRHGKLNGEFRFDGNKFLFKAPEEPRDNHVLNHGPKAKKTYNRGNHFNADYPNEAFRLYNERKKEVAILNKIQGRFKSKAHEIEFNKITDAALKTSLKNIEQQEKNSFTPLRDYGGPVRLRPRDRSLMVDEDSSGGPRSQRSYQYYNVGAPIDDGSVEIDLSQSRASSTEPTFDNKVQESIWRLKNNK
jgi:hypothetical protein